ncbi:MAG: hypothetical protein J5764_00070 [Bacteroidales bacterium]|nr:hypothetical protein [Bacteroidales bacterium]
MSKFRLILPMLMMSAAVFAQVQTDSELNFLVGAVCELRQADEVSFNHVRELLSPDTEWTPMNETRYVRGRECSPSDGVPGFGLNRLLSSIVTGRKPLHVHGDMLNGEDERYQYSLYEHSVHAGTEVSYTVYGREGRQCFVLVAFDADGGDLSASIAVNEGVPVPFHDAGNGILIVNLEPSGIDLNIPLTINVRGGTRDQYFVILNHNTRGR